MYKVVRIRINSEVFKRFKVLCAALDLSIPNQTTQLIKDFLIIHEKNLDILKEIKK